MNILVVTDERQSSTWFEAVLVVLAMILLVSLLVAQPSSGSNCIDGSSADGQSSVVCDPDS